MIKVIGIGSPFGDDQAGWKVVESLKEDNFIQSHYQHVDANYFDRPGIRLLNLMYNANTVFLIDAVKSGNTIGTVFRFQDNEIQAVNSMLSTHHMGVVDVLKLGSMINELPDSIILYGIEIDTIELNSVISEVVEKAIKQVVLYLKDEIINLLNRKEINLFQVNPYVNE